MMWDRENKAREQKSRVSALVKTVVTAPPSNEEDPTFQRPSDEEIAELTDKTKKVLKKIIRSKFALPWRCIEKQAPAQYFLRYTPSQQGQWFNSSAKQRIFRMVEGQVDPLEPPKFVEINMKIPREPPSPPVPIMHSPTRKVTIKKQKEWRIPPCISNWKNAKGYTIPLDKRLATDGRGLQQVHINEKFAKLADALNIAERKAREAVEMRAQLEKKLAQKEKEKKEDYLRQLARKVREERAGLKSAATSDEAEESRERDQLRQQRHTDRARERNLARVAPEKRSRLQRERERDISEQIALGLPAKSIPNTGEAQFDQRLFNTSKGIDSGYGHNDEYNVYDKPWKDSNSIASYIYRPSKNIDKDTYGEDLEKLVKTNRFVPDKEFNGTDRSATRSGPVQFEKDEEDPFGLDQFLKQAKRTSRSTTTTTKRKDERNQRRDDRDKRRKH